MRILIFGASGYIGRHVTRRLVGDGHAVTAWVRNDAGAAIATAAGATPEMGGMEDLAALADAALAHDAVLWIAQLLLEDERQVVHAMLQALEDTGRLFVFTGGASLLSTRTNGDWIENNYAEDDPFIPRRQIAPRLEIETMVRGYAERGLRAVVVRPPLVWGHGGSKVIADLFHSGTSTGSVCYVGRGLNVYSSIHVDDLADLYSRVLDRGVAGALYHAVSGETSFRNMAEAVAQTLNLPTRSISVAESIEVWDKFTGPIVFSGCSRTRSPRARADLGWAPDETRLDIIEECRNPAYVTGEPRAAPPWMREPA